MNLKPRYMNLLDLLEVANRELEASTVLLEKLAAFLPVHQNFESEVGDRIEAQKLLIVSVTNAIQVAEDPEVFVAMHEDNPYSCFGRQPHRMDFMIEEDYKLRFNQWQDWETWKELNKK